MRTLASASAGFLLAVLWFDLMFDVQVHGHRGGDLPAEVLGSIGAYYRRVTTGASPMNRLVAAAMLATVAGLAGVIARAELPRWRGGLALALAVVAIGIAAARTVRNAKRLGGRGDPLAEQYRLARAIHRDHVACCAMIAAVVLLLVLPA